jgi:membrane protein implicated in regulation of membrane protease activity
MTSPERIYRGSVRAFSLVLIALGLAILISALANGAGPLSVGVFLGVAFLAVGAGRLWISARMGSQDER